ncbi:ROK family transcriptional regulator [Saccharothrix sp. 6-C]|uniref:Putative NBD/HSP70 family sugar kinase n=1 Tax=Saccharothrix texasensis TaxID=103734 RepID=A0A3N1HCY5_9PSEU|nr:MULTISPECIES: ROK family transcriptional regulator [Saccharothrix]QQQ75538.1 ROK family transcriptional regulator [Saccharothrix sp. 6-C]ROP40365.1 putative NBD/HSP70 family sugar kinase [Saccharothrix texasensis]
MSGPARATQHASSKSAVLDVIRAAGTISRVGLINATGFTGATISTVVRKLIDEGLVVETGRAESTGGKRRVLLQLNHSSRYAVGVHLDHAGITYVLTNLGGSVVARISRAGAGAAEPRTVVARMAAEVKGLIDGVGVEHNRVLGLGLVSPGPLSSDTGMGLTPPSMRKWEDFPLAQELERATSLPVVLDNDATAAALGEHWSGAIGGTAISAALYMGTGIGAGLVINGITYRGSSGNAGEIGHICVDADGPECWCGARGCVEVLAGPAAVVAAARADAALAGAAGLTGRARSVSSDFAAVSRAARRGEPSALAILERSARYIAVAARTLANIMDLEVLVLTGPSFAIAGSVYLPVVRDELDRAFFSRAAHGVDVRLSRSAATASAIGGAALVLQSELVPLHEGLRLPENLADSEPAALADSGS